MFYSKDKSKQFSVVTVNELSFDDMLYVPIAIVKIYYAFYYTF